jgi:hypothetical protein
MRIDLQSAHGFAVCIASTEAWNFGTQFFEVIGNCEADNVVLVALTAARWLSDWNDNWVAAAAVLKNPNVGFHLRGMGVVPSKRHQYFLALRRTFR